MQALCKSVPGAESPKGIDLTQQGAWPLGWPALACLKCCGIEELPFTAG